MRERVLQAICQLEGINIAQPELDIGIHHQLGQPQNFSAQMESIAKAGLLALLGGQRLDGLQVEVVVQMQVVEVLAMDEQVQHVVALSADLQKSETSQYSFAHKPIALIERLKLHDGSTAATCEVQEEEGIQKSGI